MIPKITKGHLTPIIETVDKPDNLMQYFNRLRKGKKNTLLFESKEIVPNYGEFSVGTNDPCLKVSGRDELFEIEALNNFGMSLLREIKNKLVFCDEVKFKGKKITGRLSIKSKKSIGDELERLKKKNHTDILRALAFAYTPARIPDYPYGGLFGVFSYDFIDQFEELPKNKSDPLDVPDYTFYYLDNLFVINHRTNKMHIIANAIGINEKGEEYIHERCLNKIKDYKDALARQAEQKFPISSQAISIGTDTSKHDYIEIVKKMKRHILQGDVFQVVPSRTIIAQGKFDSLQVYEQLRSINPSPYMFFIDFGDHQLVGSSPELAVRVKGKGKKRVEIRPIAGTKPRGLNSKIIDNELDSRYEVELKTDEKELAEHMMLVDLARNDVAKISAPGTRVVDEPLVIEKYSHVQHLVSNVSGILKKEFDALHAYLATMNMGTVCGAPKIEAMKILRENEKSKRGYYGGAVAYITPDGDFDSGLVIRSIVVKQDSAYIRVGAGIVHDSIPEKEFQETEHKAGACLKVISGGRK